MAKPTKLPRWATGGSADILEPSEGQKDDGWAASQKPPAQWWDWLLNLNYQWIVHFLSLQDSNEIIVHASGVGGTVGCTYSNALSGYWNVTGGPGEVQMPLQVSPGNVITDWSVDIRDTVSPVNAVLLKAVAGAAPTTIGATQASAGNTTDQTLSHTLASPETVVSGTYYYVRLTMPSNNMRFYGGSYTRDFSA